jgi:hypothetical protein
MLLQKSCPLYVLESRTEMQDTNRHRRIGPCALLRKNFLTPRPEGDARPHATLHLFIRFSTQPIHPKYVSSCGRPFWPWTSYETKCHQRSNEVLSTLRSRALHRSLVSGRAPRRCPALFGASQSRSFCDGSVHDEFPIGMRKEGRCWSQGRRCDNLVLPYRPCLRVHYRGQSVYWHRAADPGPQVS